MKIKHASPPPLRRALETLAAVATGSDGLATGSDVSMRMSRTPRALSLSRIAWMPLSKAGLLLSPAISTARQRSAGTVLPTGGSGARASAGGAPVDSGVQPARRRARRRVLTPNDMPFGSPSHCGSLRLGSHGAQCHVGVEPGHLLLAQFAARTVPHRDVGTLVEKRHGDRLEVATAVDLRRVEHAQLDALDQDADQDVADRPAAAADVGDAVGAQPSDLAVGDQRLDPQPAMAHDIDAHEGGELGARIVAGSCQCLLADPLELGLGRGDDVVQELVLGFEMVVERALRQPAGLHDVAHRDHGIAAL